MANDNNLGLIVVGLVAIVAIVGMLNFNGITGKLSTSETAGSVILKDGSLAWCDPVDCKKANNGIDCGGPLPAGSEAPCGYNMARSDGTTYAVYYKP